MYQQSIHQWEHTCNFAAVCCCNHLFVLLGLTNLLITAVRHIWVYRLWSRGFWDLEELHSPKLQEKVIILRFKKKILYTRIIAKRETKALTNRNSISLIQKKNAWVRFGQYDSWCSVRFKWAWLPWQRHPSVRWQWRSACPTRSSPTRSSTGSADCVLWRCWRWRWGCRWCSTRECTCLHTTRYPPTQT